MKLQVKKRPHIFIIFLLNIIILSGVCNAQAFADKDYYLIDSLILENLSETDRQLIDSCLTIYHVAKNDTSKINAISFIVEESWDDNVWPNYNQWVFQFVQKKLPSATSVKVTRHLKISVAVALNNMGYISDTQGDISSALEYYNKSLKIQKEVDNKDGIAISLNNIGVVYDNQGDIPNALIYYHKSLKIQEGISNKLGVAKALINIGYVYSNQDDIPKALEYFLKSLNIMEEIGDKKGETVSLNNIGAIYSIQGNTTKALEFNHKSLKIQEERGDKYGIARSLYNLGVIYANKGDIPKALEYYSESLKIREELGDKWAITQSLNSIGEVYFDNGNSKEAKKHAQQSLVMAQELGYPESIENASKLLSEIYEKQKKGLPALEMYKLYIVMRDSMFNEENNKSVAQQQAKYQYEKIATADSVVHAEAQKVKDALLSAEQAQNKQHQIEAKRQKQQAYFLFGGLGLAILFGGFIFNRFRVTSKQKEVIEQQKNQVDEAFEELEEKNTEIMDSINYAKRIQSAILPPSKIVKEYLQNSFILYKPKDVVAGDFYWLEHRDNKVLFAAADCTGHGVPGAMVSVICNNGLNRSVREHGLTAPGEILDKTREIVIQEFEKSEEEVKDGMDIALCSLEFCLPAGGFVSPSLSVSRSEEQGTINKEHRTVAKLQYAGAHNPLWIIRKGEVLETKANKQPIGKFDKQTPYTTHIFELRKDDAIYIFSDGYVDQFGGDRGKKFKTKAFRELLLSIQEKSMEEQRLLIDEAFESWRGDVEQVDDVCVIGVRV